MKLLITLTLCVVVSIMFLFTEWGGQKQAYAQKAETADEVLKKVSDRLSGLRSLKYKYQLELNYASEGYKASIGADAYVEFIPVDKTIGLKYQFGTPDTLQVYNGSERFELNRKDKTIKIDVRPAREYFSRVTVFHNSPVTLRSSLPSIITDPGVQKTISETTINERPVYLVDVILHKRTIGRLGGYDEVGLDRKIIYRLTVDKATYMPVEVLQTNSANQDFMKATFSEIEANAGPPDQLSWYYSTYLGEYRRADNAAGKSLIPVGKSAPEFNLPAFGTGSTVSSSQFKGKVVLLEFWISHCGVSIDAVAKLNALVKKYKGGDFKILAINAHDTDEVISLFVQNNKPTYEILTGGHEAAKNYGVDGFPTIILIDKAGNVVYSGGLDEKRLADLIEKSLR